EADLEGGPLRYAVAANYRLVLATNDTLKTGTMNHYAGLDALIKLQGFDAGLALFLVHTTVTIPTAPMVTVERKNKIAAHVNLGYFLTPKQWQLTGRFAIIPRSGAQPPFVPVVEGQELEMRLGFNYYFHGHNWKWVNDAGLIQDTGTNGA